MKRILIVEDNTTKQLAIEKALEDGEYSVLAAQTIAIAYSLLSMESWDAIVLDMTFHATVGAGHESSKESLAGLEVLQYMGRLRIPTPVVVATQHSSFESPEIPGLDSIEKLDVVLRQAFPRNYKATIAVDLSRDEWRAQLRAAVRAALGDHS